MQLALLLIMSLGFGLIIGSFLNVVILRLNEKKSLLGRSACPQCWQKIVWKDNIPLVSFFILGGKCRNCKKRISFQYPIVELISGVLFVFAAFFLYQKYQVLNFLFFLDIIRHFFIISVLTVIFVSDFRWYIIPDVVTLPSIVIVFFLNLFLGMSWHSLVLGGIIGSGFFLIQYLISHGNWIGGGDITLGGLMGIILGWQALILAFLIAYVSGAVVGVYLLLRKKKELSSKIPFGTFLSLATLISLIYGSQIVNYYTNLFT